MVTTPTILLLLLLLGAAAGVIGAILGVGGGIFLVPLLVLAFGVPMHYAVAASIVSVIATSSAVAATNVERGTANMRLGMTLELATALGAISGGLTAGLLSESVLRTVFAVVMLPMAALMWRGKTESAEAEFDEFDPLASGAAEALENWRSAEDSEPENGRTASAAPSRAGSAGFASRLRGDYHETATGKDISYEVRHLGGGMGISFLAGNVSGLLGVGGGVFKVPALHLLCNVPIKAAAATSNFMIGVTAAASAFLYYGRGEVRPGLTASVVLGVLAGSALGSHVNRYIHGRYVNRLFAVVLAAAAVQMALRAWR